MDATAEQELIDRLVRFFLANKFARIDDLEQSNPCNNLSLGHDVYGKVVEKDLCLRAYVPTYGNHTPIVLSLVQRQKGTIAQIGSTQRVDVVGHRWPPRLKESINLWKKMKRTRNIVCNKCTDGVYQMNLGNKTKSVRCNRCQGTGTQDLTQQQANLAYDRVMYKRSEAFKAQHGPEAVYKPQGNHYKIFTKKD